MANFSGSQSVSWDVILTPFESSIRATMYGVYILYVGGGLRITVYVNIFPVLGRGVISRFFDLHLGHIFLGGKYISPQFKHLTPSNLYL